jgi:hypothetical protein
MTKDILKVNLVIVNYNCWKDTVSCIDSIYNSTFSNFQIFVIDNASTYSDVNHIIKWLEKKTLSYRCVNRVALSKKEEVIIIDKTPIIIVKNHENLGFATGNNVALNYLIKQRGNEFVWLLNPDTIIEPEVMENLVDLAQNKKKKIFGNIMYHIDQNHEIIQYGGFRVRNFIHGISYITKKEDTYKIDSISGASIFTNIETFKELGVLPEEYFMYWEETDFCTKALRHQYSFEVNDKSKIFDRGGTFSNSNFLREYLYLFNGFRYYKKYKPLNLFFILISTMLKQLIAIITGDKIKSKAIFYAHIDFISLILGVKIDVQKRVFENK